MNLTITPGKLSGKDALLLFVPDALFVKYVEIGLLGPLHQPSVTGEDAAPRRDAGSGAGRLPPV